MGSDEPRDRDRVRISLRPCDDFGWARPWEAHTRGMANRAALAVLAISLGAPAARADGELGPMFGGGIVATHGSDTDVAGVGAELVQWLGPIGLAAEASRQWTVDDAHGPQLGTLGASLRVLAFDHVVPSLFDAREVVELGIELQGVVERTWRDDANGRDPVSYGLGLALRLRGATDDDRSNLLAESRLFVRVLRARSAEADVAARETMPAAVADGTSVILGLGAVWGGGQPAYVAGLRRRNALDAEWMLAR